MQQGPVLARVQSIVRDVLDDDDVELSLRTEARDIPHWDSLAHMRILIAVEENFEINFTVEELNSFDDVGCLVDGIVRNLDKLKTFHGDGR